MQIQKAVKQALISLKPKKSLKWVFKICFLLFTIWFLFFSLPNPLFKSNYSTLLLCNKGNLLGAKLASDQQWRFPQMDSVPKNLSVCLKVYEDEYFKYHPGFNPISVIKAIADNVKHKKIKRGGSTITMQVIRMALGNKKRTVFQKIKETILALRLELTHSKKTIMKYYASNAPFGGNVVGADAASWRYFGRLSNYLSWAEAATLAVLPNSPANIYPGKNQKALLKKRNTLLLKLLKLNYIDKETYQLSIAENLPTKPNPLPNIAYHFLHFLNQKNQGIRWQSSLNKDLQLQVQSIVNKHNQQLSLREIHNIACIVTEVETGKILAYVGNTNQNENKFANRVDICQSARSSGSILKPILYADLIAEGKLLPNMLLPDIPMNTIQNFYKQYDGAVPANQALARSLNIPAVHLLQQFGVQNFQERLTNLGFQHINKPANHYGLSLIIGGGEVTPYEVAQAYTNFAKAVKYPNEKLQYLNISKTNTSNSINSNFSSFSNFVVLKSLQAVQRPESETGWQNFGNPYISWKTGTSHGFKDAWAVGMTSKYVVTIWVGNATGEGRPEMTGTKVAAPILFDVFQHLNVTEDFIEPKAKTQYAKICKYSGYIANSFCNAFNIEKTVAKSNLPICPFCAKIAVDSTLKYRVNSSCYPVFATKFKQVFVLPPKMAHFYQLNNPFYEGNMPFLNNCVENIKRLEIIYPRNSSEVFIPRNLLGVKEPLVFEAVHSTKNGALFWHLDNVFIGKTLNSHKIEVTAVKGKHILTVTDNFGEKVQSVFKVVN